VHLFVIESNLGVGENKKHLVFSISMFGLCAERDIHYSKSRGARSFDYDFIIASKKGYAALNARRERKKMGRPGL
jgi:hypothetical protein